MQWFHGFVGKFGVESTGFQRKNCR